MSNNSILPIDRTLAGSTTHCQSGARSNGNEGVLCISESSSISEVSPSDCLESYAGHSSGEFEHSAEMQSAYFRIRNQIC